MRQTKGIMSTKRVLPANRDRYTFVPTRVYFEPRALEEYELARRLKRQFEEEGIPVRMTTSHNQVRGIPGDTPRQAYREAKRTLASDPLTVEPYGGGLARAIEYFAQQEHGRFRFVTKYRDVDSLLELEHRGHTEVRFSINSRYVTERFEPGVPPNSDRIRASARVAESGYPFG